VRGWRELGDESTAQIRNTTLALKVAQPHLLLELDIVVFIAPTELGVIDPPMKADLWNS